MVGECSGAIGAGIDSIPFHDDAGSPTIGNLVWVTVDTENDSLWFYLPVMLYTPSADLKSIGLRGRGGN